MQFNNIPEELKAFPQWIVWKLEETQNAKPTKVPYNAVSGNLASVTDSSTWCDFETAVAASGKYSGIGFVLTANDPFAVIDLDDPYELDNNGNYKHKNPDEILDRQIKVYKEFGSFAEKSPSGKGLHIWVKGSVASGRRRSAIEIYSNARYMTVTGDVYNDSPILDKQELLSLLWQQMGGDAVALIYTGDEPEKESDEIIVERACNAKNGELFTALLKGNWRDYYPSQSEADFAFVDIVAFYTQNVAQISRIFKSSALGQRPKALRKDYIDYMIKRCFDRMLPPVDVDGLRNQLEAALAAKTADCTKKRQREKPQEAFSEPTPTLTLPQKPKNPYTIPPCLMGEIAAYIYSAAPRPVPEIALSAAIGLMAGICGRSYNISGTGLNQYIMLLAPTGSGKEAIANGINKLMAAVQRTVPAANEFIGPAEIKSPEALIKYMCKTSSCFVSLVGEFGLVLKQLSAHNANTNQIGIRRIMLDLYNKSGDGNVLHPMIYSDKDKNTEPLLSPSFTLLGESTPEKFYEALNESLIEEGLLPRFTIIEYDGQRPPLNESHLTAAPSFHLIERMSALCAHSLTLINAHKPIVVKVDSDEVKKLLTDFDKYCDDQINSSNKEAIKHLWNRGHIKVLKLSALVAVGCNPYDPVIEKEHVDWSINIIVSDVLRMLKRFETGEVGNDTEETKQVEQVCKAFRDYVSKDFASIDKYKATNAKLHNDKIVTFSYIHKRLACAAAFRKDKKGATDAIHRSINILKEQGDIREMTISQTSKDYGYSGKCYTIVNVQRFKI